MRNEKKGKKTEETAQAHVAESTQIRADKQSKKSPRTPTSHRAERSTKPRIEQYGTGTPVEEEPVAHSFLCPCGARFDSRDEYAKHRSGHEGTVDAPLTQKEIERGEQGQTEEERREWQEVQRSDGA